MYKQQAASGEGDEDLTFKRGMSCAVYAVFPRECDDEKQSEKAYSVSAQPKFSRWDTETPLYRARRLDHQPASWWIAFVQPLTEKVGLFRTGIGSIGIGGICPFQVVLHRGVAIR